MRFVSLCIVTIVTFFTTNEHVFAREQNVTGYVTNNSTSGNFSQGAFSYRIGNAISNQYREEHRDSQGVVRGSYGFRTPLGEFREVKYMADDAGFRAQVISNEPGVSQQNPADVQVRKVSSHQLFGNQKVKQQLLVAGGYPLQNDLIKRGMINPSLDNHPAIVHRAQPSATQDTKERPTIHEDHQSIDHFQNDPKIPSESLEVPARDNPVTSPWNKQDPNHHSAQPRFREKPFGNPQQVLPNILTLTPKTDERHLSKNDLISPSEQHRGNPYPQRNKWVLGFIPFGIRADHINDMTKKLSSGLNSPETNDIPNPTMFFDLKSPVHPPSHSNKKNCKIDDSFYSGEKINQLPRENPKESQEQRFKLSAFDSENGNQDVQHQQSKQSETADSDIYLIQSIFAKRLAGIINSGGIFPPHLLPHSIKVPNQNPELGIGPYQDINRTQSKSEQWTTGHVSEDTVEDKPKQHFDITDTNLNSVQKDYPFPLQPISISMSGKSIFSETPSQSQVHSSEEAHFHKIGRRGESGQSSSFVVPKNTRPQNREKTDEFIVRNFYDGKVYSTRIKTNNDQEDNIENINSDLISNRFHENSGVNKNRIRTTLNSGTTLELPQWAGGHRLFEIPQLNRPLYDSKGIQIKPEDVPLHLHRFMPPKPQYSNRDNSFRFAIPRPVPPRSVVIPPKPPMML